MTKRQDPVKNTVITIDVPDIGASLKSVEKLGGKTVKKKEAVADMGFTAYFKDSRETSSDSGKAPAACSYESSFVGSPFSSKLTIGRELEGEG